MGLDLLLNQVLLGNLDLLVFGVAGKADDLHAIQQRLRHAQAVGGAQEHHVGQVVVDREIVVIEARVLLGIQDLKEGGGRIAAPVCAQLVDQNGRASCRESECRY